MEAIDVFNYVDELLEEDDSDVECELFPVEGEPRIMVVFGTEGFWVSVTQATEKEVAAAYEPHWAGRRPF